MGKAAKGKPVRRTAPPPPPVAKGRPLARVQGNRFWLIAAAAVVAFIAFGLSARQHSSSSGAGSGPLPASINQASLASLQTGRPPWPAEIAHLAGRLQTLGLPQLGQEGSTLHIHQHLDVFLNGRPVTVPSGIGIDGNSFISPVHTHDPSGVIHVESATSQRFTLGQFFAIWGVHFTAQALGGSTGPVKVYVNGKPAAGDLSRVELRARGDRGRRRSRASDDPLPLLVPGRRIGG